MENKKRHKRIDENGVPVRLFLANQPIKGVQPEYSAVGVLRRGEFIGSLNMEELRDYVANGSECGPPILGAA